MQTTSDARQRSLVVIGAGMAGIKLAHHCLENDPKMRIIIIEANNYVGGRMRSFDFEGHTVEMGANWISGLEGVYDNPVWRLARDVGLDGHRTERDTDRAVHATDGKGNDVTQSYMESMRRFDHIYEKAVKACAAREMTVDNDADVRSVLEEFGWKEEDLSAVDRAVEYNFLEVWVADGLEKLSAAHDMKEGANDVDLGKEEVFVEDQRGFNCILDGMVRDIEEWGCVIRLNTEVQRVKYSPGDVTVTTKELISGAAINYKADFVVSTVSLGVLQGGGIEFLPPIPDWKAAALNEIGMFTFAKVFCKFKEAFQIDKDQIFVCSERKGHYPLWMKYRNTDQNIFMCYLGGQEAKRVESLTIEEIKSEVEELFQNAYQSNLGQEADPDIFRPSAVSVTNWSKNPRFCGSYSFFPVHAFSDVPEVDLTSGLSGTEDREDPTTLYFAGECFDDKFNGWVQGAYRSGERVAKTILGIKEQ